MSGREPDGPERPPERSLEELKRAAGEAAAAHVRDGMTLGLGTGSTVAWTIRRLGEMARAGLRIRGVATSRRTEELAGAVGIPLVTFADAAEIDLAIDGADEIGPGLHLIKGGGGALLREKLVAAASRRLIIVADETKRVPVLGAFPLPVEVVPWGWEATARLVAALGCSPRLRMAGTAPFVTDNGNWVLDCPFGSIPDPAGLHRELKALVGVVETGLFVGMADLALIAAPGGVEAVMK
jgi:ribose 5-phosphate isomerase A